MTVTHHKVSRRQFSLAKVFVLTAVFALTLGLLRDSLPFQDDVLSFLALLMAGLFGIVFLATRSGRGAGHYGRRNYLY